VKNRGHFFSHLRRIEGLLNEKIGKIRRFFAAALDSY
jgi:hypothetical protein